MPHKTEAPAMAPLDSRSAHPVTELSWTLRVQGREVPLSAWLPVQAAGPRPLVLVGHGGSGDRRSDFVLDAVRRLGQGHGFAVAAIDGPVHGQRRAAPASPEAVRDEFRALWERGGSIEPMVADWRAALDLLCDLEGIDAGAVGYYGLSMGTAYGLPLLAQEPRLRAAVIGMWGTSRIHGERLLEAARQVHGATLFSLQWDDPLFSREGQFALFDALAASDKHMAIHPGGHVNPSATRLDGIEDFLVRALRTPRGGAR